MESRGMEVKRKRVLLMHFPMLSAVPPVVVAITVNTPDGRQVELKVRPPSNV
jgi:hypothetical protein